MPILQTFKLTLRRQIGNPTMKSTACPFCGVASDVPHHTQEGCIEALHAEIARMREILDGPVPVPDESERLEEGPEIV